MTVIFQGFFFINIYLNFSVMWGMYFCLLVEIAENGILTLLWILKLIVILAYQVECIYRAIDHVHRDAQKN